MSNLIGVTGSCQEGGPGVLFKVSETESNSPEYPLPAFIICFDGQYYAYLNRCGHIAVPLDYRPGNFFSDDGSTLVCATHGAEYAPDTGATSLILARQ